MNIFQKTAGLSTKNKLKFIFGPLFRSPVLRLNYFLGNYKEVIWLFGDGRSGTTWISNVINHNKKFREMFEPFHPVSIEAASPFLPHQYERPENTNKALKKFYKTIFTGRVLNRRIDQGNKSLVYKGLLVKDILSNPHAYWASLNFPQVKPVLLIRNPFAVALSKSKRKDWFWLTDPSDLLQQRELNEDFLLPFTELIEEVKSENDFILNQVLIWCIINLIPIKQFPKDKLTIIFYESFYQNPEKEIKRLQELSSIIDVRKIPESIIRKPSMVTDNRSSIRHGKSPATSWKEEIPADTIIKGNRIMEAFGFTDLYDSEVQPNYSVIEKLQNS